MSCNEAITIARGTVESQVFRYGIDPLVYIPITAKTEETPLEITATGHGVPDGWPVALNDIGYDDLEAVDEGDLLDGDLRWFDATKIDDDTLQFLDVDLARLIGTWANGFIVYQTPVNLAGASAELKVYDVDGTVLATFTAVLDNTAKTITVEIDQTDPEDANYLDLGTYTFALLFTDSLGKVTAIDEGTLIVYTPGSPP